MIDSRSEIHPDWVQLAIKSIELAGRGYVDDFIIVKNTDRAKTIGKCWNSAVKKVKNEWVFFMGDDDWVVPDFFQVFNNWIEKKDKNPVNITSNMTVYNETGKAIDLTHLQRPHTGFWKTEYVKKHPFNEKLTKGIDREYVEEVEKRGDFRLCVHYYAGYHYRQHDDYSCAGKIKLVKEPGDFYINARYPTFIAPVAERLKSDYTVTVDNHPFDPLLARNAKVMWCDWGDDNAVKIADWETDAVKILRIHAYEVFGRNLFYIDFNKFDKVIFVAEHIKEYAERSIGYKINNAVVIPNGISIPKYSLNKVKNNRIAWAGNIDRKKGAGELIMLANNFPEYEFCVAGKWHEKDVGEFFVQMAPDNVSVEPYSYDITEFFKDKTYYLNTSMREGCPVTPLQAMAAGLKPVIRKWYGADKYLPKEWLWSDYAEFNSILDGAYAPERYRDYVETRYNFDVMYDKFKEIIDGYDKGSIAGTG